MANKSVFASKAGRLLPVATARNAEEAPAHAYPDDHALAQLAVTGSFGTLFYSRPEAELARVLELAERVEPRFLAKAAVYARINAHMKDMPAVLLAVLARRDPALFRAAFGRVVDNGKMLRTFVQVVRSGRTGRKSLGSAPKAMVQAWLAAASDRDILEASVGKDPSLADVIRMVHPTPQTAARRALYAWVLGKPCDVAALPAALQNWLAFKAAPEGKVPAVPFQMLTQLPLTAEHWAELADAASWQMLRQGLNTFLRHGAFARSEAVGRAAAKLADPQRIARARLFPYQLMVALSTVAPEMPAPIRDALHAAMEASVANLPRLAGSVAVCPDVSGSMGGPVTGWRKGATSAVRCIDVAALVAATVLRANPQAEVLPFETKVRELRLEPRDTIATNAARLAALGGGGTNCSAPLAWLNARGEAPDLVLFVSDNQSWVDAAGGGQSTAMLAEWERLKRRNAKARLVAIDIAPYGTTQAAERDDILNVGGFSDAVFDQVAAFARGEMSPRHWLAAIEAVEL